MTNADTSRLLLSQPLTGTQPGSVFGETYACSVPRSVSVLINNFNYCSFVRSAIESALAQTRAAQVIVVDDGSSDGSKEQIASFGGRILSVFQPNGGQASAMNHGIRLATGDLVVFLDSDDLLESHAVERLLDLWRPATVLGQFPLTILDADGRPCGVYPDPPGTQLADGDVRSELLTTGSFPTNVTSGLAFARKALDYVAPIPERQFRNNPDGYLTRAVAFLGLVQRFDERLGFYRKHDRNESSVSASPEGLAAGFRKKIRWADAEFATTLELARRHGLRVAPDLGDNDPNYLGYRLFSVLLDPDTHPIPNDRRWALLSGYMQKRWRSAWPLHRKIMALTMAATATASPYRMSAVLIRWLHDSASRPAWLRALAPKRT